MGSGVGFGLGLGLPLARVRARRCPGKEVEACAVGPGGRVKRGGSEGRKGFERRPSCRRAGRTGDGFDGGRGTHPLWPSMPVAPIESWTYFCNLG